MLTAAGPEPWDGPACTRRVTVCMPKPSCGCLGAKGIYNDEITACGSIRSGWRGNSVCKPQTATDHHHAVQLQYNSEPAQGVKMMGHCSSILPCQLAGSRRVFATSQSLQLLEGISIAHSANGCSIREVHACQQAQISG
jgi:hypothetical protein